MFACRKPAFCVLLLGVVLVLLTRSAGAQQQITVIVQAYEVSREDAAALLAADPAKLDVVSGVHTLSAMSTKQTSKILKLGSAAGPSGGRLKGSDTDGSFEAESSLSPDGRYADLIISATVSGSVTTTSVAVPSKGFAFIGAVDQGPSGKVIMIFVRLS